MIKQKDVLLFHPHISEENNVNFEGVLNHINSIDQAQRTLHIKGSNIIIIVKQFHEKWRIDLQVLKDDELPKIADSDDGRNEKELPMPDGKSLSYKNVFIYDPRNNILGGVKLFGCPQIGKLRYCIETIMKQVHKHFRLRFCLIFNNDLIKTIKKAKKISFAKFTSLDFDGENISEENLSKFGQYLGGKDYVKTTTLRGRKGQNIKSIVQSVIDDVISNDESELPINIKMEIDGTNIDFQNYYKKYPVNVEMDKNNKKYVDYEDLAKKIIEVIQSYQEEYAEC